MKTITGVPLEMVPKKLAALLPAGAYKGVPGGADLTDINTGFMIERLTEVFGLRGVGWKLDYQPCDIEIIPMENAKRPMVLLKYAIFSFALTNDKDVIEWFQIITSGANVNELAYALEGVRTSAIGSAIKWLCFQLPVYKGEYDHHDAKDSKKEAKAENPERTFSNLLKLAQERGLSEDDAKLKLKSAGYKEFNPAQWDSLVAALA